MDDKELLRKAIDAHIASLSDSIDFFRQQGTELDNNKLATFYDAVLELLKLGKQIDNPVLIDLLTQMGKPIITEKQQQQTKQENKSVNTSDLSAGDGHDILKKALYGWPTKL